MDLPNQLEGAENLLAQGRIDDAVSICHEILTLEADNPQALIILGQCARRSGNHEASLGHFHAAAGQLPQDIWRKLDVAEELLALGRLGEAMSVCHEILTLEADNPQALIILGQCARRSGDREASLGHFQAAAAQLPHDIWRKLDVAEELLALSRLGEAMSVCHEILTLEADNPQALIILGQCARRSGDREASLGHFQAAAAQLPHDIWRKLDVIEELLALDRSDEVDVLYREILVLEPHCQQARIGLGRLARGREGPEASLAYFLAEGRENPDATWPRLEAATDLRDLGRWEAAETEYREALRLDPHNLYALIGCGHCAQARGNREEALAAFEEATRSAPADPWPWLELAHEYREAGNSEAARRVAHTLLRDHPNDLNILRSLAMTERLAGQGEVALAVLKQAHMAHPNDIDLLVDIAREEHGLGLHAECDARLSQVLSTHPFHIGAVQLHAERLITRGEIVAAHTFYESAAAAQPREQIFQLGFLTTLAGLGQLDEAIDILTALYARQSLEASLLVKYIMLLRQSGRLHDALVVARDATLIHGRDFWILLERFYTEILFDDPQSIESCLLKMKPAGRFEKAILERNWGLYEEIRNNFDLAKDRYDESVRLNPADPSPLSDLARLHMLKGDFVSARSYLQQVSIVSSNYQKLRQHSTNVSQTFYGQLVNEFIIDRNMVSAIGALYPLPPKARAKVLRLIARQNPESTAPAQALLLAMRQADELKPNLTELGGIPKTIAQFWDSMTVPPDIQKLMRTWPDNNIDYKIEYFNLRTAMEFLASHFSQPVLNAFQRARSRSEG